MQTWIHEPLRRQFKLDSDFFQDGNTEFLKNSPKVTVMLPGDAQTSVSHCTRVNCETGGCSQAFSTVPLYESHYNLQHRHCCSYCKTSFITNYLLELHILENHDAFFQTASENKDLYQCLVEGCQERFRDSNSRKKHVVESHRYPTDFRFYKIKQDTMRPKESAHAATGTTPMELEADGEDKGARKKLPRGFTFGRGIGRGFKKSGKPSKGKVKAIDMDCPAEGNKSTHRGNNDSDEAFLMD